MRGVPRRGGGSLLGLPFYSYSLRLRFAETPPSEREASRILLQSLSVAGVQDFFDFLAGMGQIFEIAHNLAHGVHDGKGMGIAAADIGNGSCLGLVHHADEHIGLLAGVHAYRGDQCGGMAGSGNDITGDFQREIRKNFKALVI